MPNLSALHARRTAGSVFVVLVVLGVLATLVTTARAAAVTPVKADPRTAENAPSANGRWFGWVQDSRAEPGVLGYYVQRGDQRRVKVNAPRTRAPSGSVLDNSVVYIQQRAERRAQLYSFDLKTKRRTPLPPAANRATYRNRPIAIDGQVSADGPWVLFRGLVTRDGVDAPLQLAVVYHRVTRELRVLKAISTDYDSLDLGQINGTYATWAINGRYGATSVTRINIRTGRTTVVRGPVEQVEPPFLFLRHPATAADGTLYYWRYSQEPTQPGQPNSYQRDLIHRPIGGAAVVVTSVPGRLGPGSTYVDDRAGGSNVIYYALDNDIYRLQDRPSAD